MTRTHTKASIPTLRQSSTQEATSHIARHAMLILQQCRNTALSINIQAAQSQTKPIDTSKLTTGHFIALREKRSSSTHQKNNTSFPKQETLTSYSSNPPTVRSIHNIEKQQTYSIQKGHPRHSNLKKMKRQRNIGI